MLATEGLLMNAGSTDMLIARMMQEAHHVR